MLKTLVTGATGLVGYNIVRALLQRGRKIRVVVRSVEKAKNLFPKNIELIQGDILDKPSLAKAITGCDVVYHAAGMPEQWMRKSGVFQLVNVTGTQNIIDTCRHIGVKKLIYTSTIDVFKGTAGALFNETQPDPSPKGTAYERSKQQAFRLITMAAKQGLPVISLHPAGVYGPGPSGSPGVNNFITGLKKGRIPMLLPGGMPLVFSKDTGEGHVLAEEKGETGESYILSEGYYSLTDLAEIILHELKMDKKAPPVMPLPLVRLVSAMGEQTARLTGKAPLIPKGQLHFLRWGAIPDNTKSQKTLGWKPTPIKEGLKQTIRYLFREI